MAFSAGYSTACTAPSFLGGNTSMENKQALSRNISEINILYHSPAARFGAACLENSSSSIIPLYAGKIHRVRHPFTFPAGHFPFSAAIVS